MECKLCGRTNLKSRQLRDQHVRDAHGIQGLSYETVIATGAFLDKQNIENPERSNSITEKFQCEECTSIFNSKLEFRNHLLVLQSGIGRFHCEECYLVFNSDLRLQHHKRIHVQSKDQVYYPCFICGLTFLLKTHLDEHVDLHGKGGFKTGAKGTRCELGYEFRCPLCHDRFLSYYAYQKHFKSHEPLPYVIKERLKSGKYIFYKGCKSCGKVSFTEAQYRKHEETHLTPECEDITFKCDLCQVAFDSDFDLMDHKNYGCEICNLCCENIGSLRKHFLIEHDKRLPESKKFKYSGQSNYEGASTSASHLSSNSSGGEEELRRSYQTIPSSTLSSEMPGIRVKIELPDEPDLMVVKEELTEPDQQVGAK